MHMNLGFWKKLQSKADAHLAHNRPIIILAPMADVTDFAFREMFAKYGKPSVFFTEFVSADGLCSEKGRSKLLIDLKFSKKQKPIVAQIFTSRPDNARRVAELCVELGFDGIDINMGCPDRKIEKQGAGAMLMKSPILAQEILRSTMVGAESAGRRIPVSVKTRLGYAKDDLETWLPYLLECEPAAITIHARTRKEMSKVRARWERIGDAVKIRDKYFVGKEKPLIIGNGDIESLKDAREKLKESYADGVMVGRGAFGNPWFFNEKKKDVSISEKLKVMAEHSILFEKTFKDVKGFSVMKKHFKAYVSGFDGALTLRKKLMETRSAGEVVEIVDKFSI